MEKNTSVFSYMRFRPLEHSYSCVRAGGGTDKHDETGSSFGNFANAPKCIYYICVYIKYSQSVHTS